METFFYVMGGILVLLALGISAVGIKSDNFPSNAMLRIGVLVTALIVGATAFGAVELSQEEEGHRLDEENIAAAEEAETTTEENAAEAGGPSSGTAEIDDGEEPGVNEAQVADSAESGKEVFLSEGCGSCHSLADLGDEAAGAVGPNLDEALVDKDAAYIETSIVDPSAEIAEGFGDNIMPDDYGETLDEEQLSSLVTYLEQTAGDAQSSGGSGSGN